jgi:hypothetical protein
MIRGKLAIGVLSLILIGSAPSPSPVKVPRGSAPVIDGRIVNAEWQGAAVERLANGLDVRLRHDGKDLFVAVSSSANGFPSVCAARVDTVRVLHASAALGAVMYTRSGDAWSSRDTAFIYSMRSVDTTARARQERQAYREAHGWVASTARMGNLRNHEFQISLGRFDSNRPRIAIGYYRNDGPQVTWPESLLPASEGCAELRLLQGWVTEHPGFRPEMYAELELEP